MCRDQLIPTQKRFELLFELCACLCECIDITTTVCMYVLSVAGSSSGCFRYLYVSSRDFIMLNYKCSMSLLVVSNKV